MQIRVKNSRLETKHPSESNLGIRPGPYLANVCFQMFRLLVFGNVFEQGGFVDEALVARVALVGFIRLEWKKTLKNLKRLVRISLHIMLCCEPNQTKPNKKN